MQLFNQGLFPFQHYTIFSLLHITSSLMGRFHYEIIQLMTLLQASNVVSMRQY